MSTANSTKFMQKGFTLLELLVVIAIIGILSSIVLVSYNGYTAKARIARTLQWAGSINHSLGDRAVGVWTFDNISGSAVYDDSGLGNNGTINKGGNGTGCDIVDGVVGRAMSFDGVDDYVQLPSAVAPNGWSEITLSLWVKESENPPLNGYHKMISCRDATKFIFVGTKNIAGVIQLYAGVTDGGSPNYVTTDVYMPSLGDWHNIVFTFKNSDKRAYIYVDGVIKIDDVLGYNLPDFTGRNMYIGAS